MMNCPKCRKTTLVTKPVEDYNFSLEECSECRGMWFERGELEAALGELAEKYMQVPPGRPNPHLLCPACGKPMYSFNYPGTYVKVELCYDCRGFWLDAKEIDELVAVRAYRRSHPQKEEEQTAEPVNKEAAEPGGIKGALINMINRSLDRLTH